MASPFSADVVPQAPTDPLFGLMAAYKADTSPNKVDLGIGAYRDNSGKPWILPVVKQVRPAGKTAQNTQQLTPARPTTRSARIPTQTTNTSPSPASRSSPVPRRNSSSVATAPPSQTDA